MRNAYVLGIYIKGMLREGKRRKEKSKRARGDWIGLDASEGGVSKKKTVLSILSIFEGNVKIAMTMRMDACYAIALFCF